MSNSVDFSKKNTISSVNFTLHAQLFSENELKRNISL